MTPTTVTNTWSARRAKLQADALQAKEARLQRAWQAHRDAKAARKARPPEETKQVWMTADGQPPPAWRDVDREAKRLDVATFFSASEKLFSATAVPGVFCYATTAADGLKAVRNAAKSRGAK